MLQKKKEKGFIILQKIKKKHLMALKILRVWNQCCIKYHNDKKNFKLQVKYINNNVSQKYCKNSLNKISLLKLKNWSLKKKYFKFD